MCVAASPRGRSNEPQVNGSNLQVVDFQLSCTDWPRCHCPRCGPESRATIEKIIAHEARPASRACSGMDFLTIHQRYADRFFSCTSVLHTRARLQSLCPGCSRIWQA